MSYAKAHPALTSCVHTEASGVSAAVRTDTRTIPIPFAKSCGWEDASVLSECRGTPGYNGLMDQVFLGSQNLGITWSDERVERGKVTFIYI